MHISQILLCIFVYIIQFFRQCRRMPGHEPRSDGTDRAADTAFNISNISLLELSKVRTTHSPYGRCMLSSSFETQQAALPFQASLPHRGRSPRSACRRCTSYHLPLTAHPSGLPLPDIPPRICRSWCTCSLLLA